MIPEKIEAVNGFSKQIIKKFGIVYTPAPIINYILSGIEHILRTHFINLIDDEYRKNPLISPNIYYLDPAAGNGEFPVTLIKKILAEEHKYDRNIIPNFISRIYCYEILIDHVNILKKNFLELVNLPSRSLNIYNIDTLADPISNPLPKAKDNEILIIFGNPPYSVSTNNNGSFIKTLIEDFKKGVISKGSKKITSLRALQDDYVKFIRYAEYTLKQQWQNPGIIAFVVNHYFLDGIIFSGMRRMLYESFDIVYILDLNGEQKKEIPKIYIENGITKDENLFDIKTGFCIIFLIRLRRDVENSKDGNKGQVYFKELYGSKKIKETYLNEGFVIDDYQRLFINDQFIFKQMEFESDTYPEYHTFVDINDIFIKSSQGIVTAHDSLVSDYDLPRLNKKIAEFFRSNAEIFDENGITYKKGRDWSPIEARKLTTEYLAFNKIIKWAYRGLDRNYLCYDLPLINSSTHRYALMKYLMPKTGQFQSDNFAICVTRESYSHEWNSVLMVDIPIDNGMISGSSGSRTYLFLLNTDGINMHQKWLDLLSNHFKRQITAEHLFFFIYAILWTPTYRARYRSLLKKEFPKIPLSQWQHPTDFFDMSAYGRELANLHCFKDSEETKRKGLIEFPAFNKKDLHIIYDSKKGYSAKDHRIYFNSSFWIDNITDEIWNFEIGGIKQLENWIKNRTYSERPKKSHKTLPRPINESELEEFQIICFIIKETIALMKKIDILYRKNMNIEN
jgi:predicted helicase